MNQSFNPTGALVLTLAILSVDPCRAAEFLPTATPASQGLAMPVHKQPVPDVVGTWHGAAKTPAGEVTLVLHVERSPDATLSAKLENFSRSPGNLTPISDIKVTNGHLAFRMTRGN